MARMDYNEMRRQIGMMNLMAVGANKYVLGDDYLEFRVKIVCNRFDRMRVTLTGGDDYTLELFVRGKLKKSRDRIYCDEIGEAVYRMGTPSLWMGDGVSWHGEAVVA